MTPSKGPARVLPLLYFAAAHVALLLAFTLTALWPRAVAGFFYHAWLVGLVHLVTLGWITFSILGAMYIVAPVALRTELEPRRLDYVAYVAALVGLIGMVGHFWIQQFEGMAWSACGVAAAVAYMTSRFAGRIRRAPIERAIKLHIVLACANFWLAATMGLLIAFDKYVHFLPGFVLANVVAHAHLAALGWAAMMVVGVAYRLLPMVLPSKIPAGRWLYASAVLLEIGVLGLFASLVTRSAWAVLFAATIVGGLASFAAQVVRMLGRRVPRPFGAPRVDFALVHAASAGVWLSVTIVLGIALVIQPPSARMLAAAAAYGVLALIGFLAQMVVAMEVRLLPTAVWFWAYARAEFQVAPPSPHAMRDRHLQAIVAVGWTVGVPLLAAGMFRTSATMVGGGAWALAAATAVATIDNVSVVARAFRATCSLAPSGT
jgi:hypothetical protein